MNADVDGADVHLDNTADLMLGQVGERDIIAEQKGQTAVVILEIQALAHPLGKLIDKAENALIAAGSLLIHQIGVKFQTQLLILGLTHLDRMHLTLAVTDF